jgi:hypothetical protein
LVINHITRQTGRHENDLITLVSIGLLAAYFCTFAGGGGDDGSSSGDLGVGGGRRDYGEIALLCLLSSAQSLSGTAQVASHGPHCHLDQNDSKITM